MQKVILSAFLAIILTPLLIIGTTFAATKTSHKTSTKKITHHIVPKKSKLLGQKISYFPTKLYIPGGAILPDHKISGIFGIINSVDNGSFSILTKNFAPGSTTSTYTVNIDPKTTFAKDDKDVAESVLAAGQTVMVAGSVDTSTLAVAAFRVNIFSLHVKTGIPRGLTKHIKPKKIIRKKRVIRKK